MADSYLNLSEEEFACEVEKCFAQPNVSIFLKLFAAASFRYNITQGKKGLFFSANSTNQKLVSEMNRQLCDDTDFEDFLQAYDGIEETSQNRIILVFSFPLTTTGISFWR